MNWSPVSIAARTTLFENVNINFGGILNPYAIDPSGKTLSSFHYTETGKLFRFTSARVGVGVSLRSKKKESAKTDPAIGDPGLGDYYTGDGLNDPLNDIMFGEALGAYWAQNNYVDFDIPWNLYLDYTFSYAKPAYEKTITQAITFSGDLSLTPKWKIGFRSGYDFKNLKLTTTSINLFRDLHCWEMRMTVIPIGYLKITKRQGHLDNL
jgi:hypothetical protein